jgi:hypothetical protein
MSRCRFAQWRACSSVTIEIPMLQIRCNSSNRAVCFDCYCLIVNECGTMWYLWTKKEGCKNENYYSITTGEQTSNFKWHWSTITHTQLSDSAFQPLLFFNSNGFTRYENEDIRFKRDTFFCSLFFYRPL